MFALTDLINGLETLLGAGYLFIGVVFLIALFGLLSAATPRQMRIASGFLGTIFVTAGLTFILGESLQRTFWTLLVRVLAVYGMSIWYLGYFIHLLRQGRGSGD